MPHRCVGSSVGSRFAAVVHSQPSRVHTWSLTLVAAFCCCWSLTLVLSGSTPIREMQEPEAKPSQPEYCKVGYGNKICLHDCTEVKWNGKIGFWYHLISAQNPLRGSRLHCATEYDSCFQKFDFLRFGHPMCTVGCVWAPVWICLLVRWLLYRHNRQGKSHRVEMARG